jgi:hypothetical protein
LFFLQSDGIQAPQRNHGASAMERISVPTVIAMSAHQPQWNHGANAVESRHADGLVGGYPPAETEPRHERRGEEAERLGLDDLLAAAMEPRRERRGEFLNITQFAIFQKPQLCHGANAVGSCPAEVLLGMVRVAATEPQHEHRGASCSNRPSLTWGFARSCERL